MPFIVKESAASMPSSCKGRYRRVAVLEVREGITQVAMISTRARGVIRIVRLWDKLNDGKTDRCAAGRARVEAHELARELNDTLTRTARAAIAYQEEHERGATP